MWSRLGSSRRGCTIVCLKLEGKVSFVKELSTKVDIRGQIVKKKTTSLKGRDSTCLRDNR